MTGAASLVGPGAVIGAALVVRGRPRRHRPTLDQRVAPYLGERPSPPLAAPGQRATGSSLQKLVRTQAGELARAPGVTGSSGPYPLAGALVRANGLVAGA